MNKLGVILVLAALACDGREWKAGLARIDITPQGPIWLAGYAVRTRPSEGVQQKLWAKALALEDGSRGKVVIVTTDLIGLPRALSDVVAARVAQQYGLQRSRLLLNSSHTHSGPVVRPNLVTMMPTDRENRAILDRYADKLTDDLVNVTGAAIADLAPAKVTIGHGKTDFAINRRMRPGREPLVDHDVPVIAVRNPAGKLRGVLFGYACHNTTLGGDRFLINGDYAGWAQAELERLQPDAISMFLMLNGADANPSPRGNVSDAERHGKTLAAEVHRVVQGEMKPVTPNLAASWQTIDLGFAPHSRETFEQALNAKNPFEAIRAKAMLKAYDERRPIRSTPYPVQAIRLGKGVAILALGGEVVVGYALRAKNEFAGTDLIVAGYSNDVMCYIPTKKVLGEGGYEADDSMIYYGQPGPFTEEVEETIFRSIHNVMGRLGMKGGKQ